MVAVGESISAVPGWRDMPFDACAKPIRSRRGTVPQSEYRLGGRFPVVDQGVGLVAGYTDDESFIYRDELPLIVFGDHTRNLKFVDFPFAAGADGTKLLAGNTEVDTRFLYFALLALRIPARGYNRHYRLLRESVLPVPRDAREQRAIAGVLCKIQRAVELEEKRIAALKELKAATMAKVFREGLCGERLKKTEIGKIPESWKIVRCEDVCETISVGIVVTPAKYYVPLGVPCFRSFNIMEDRLVDRDLVYISADSNELLAKSKLKAGDVLVVRTGYPGTACVVTEEFEDANCIDLIFARPSPGRISSDYLARFLNSPSGKQQVAAGKGGLAQQHFNVGALKRLLVPLPPAGVQEEISQIGKKLDHAIVASELRLRGFKSLFASSLGQLMTGKLRVFPVSEEVFDG